MFVRNGQALGSVQVEPKAAPKPKKVAEPEPKGAEPKVAVEEKPAPEPAAHKAAPHKAVPKKGA